MHTCPVDDTLILSPKATFVPPWFHWKSPHVHIFLYPLISSRFVESFACL